MIGNKSNGPIKNSQCSFLSLLGLSATFSELLHLQSGLSRKDGRHPLKMLTYPDKNVSTNFDFDSLWLWLITEGAVTFCLCLCLTLGIPWYLLSSDGWCRAGEEDAAGCSAGQQGWSVAVPPAVGVQRADRGADPTQADGIQSPWCNASKHALPRAHWAQPLRRGVCKLKEPVLLCVSQAVVAWAFLWCLTVFPQMLCFASGANESAHVTKVVARQRSSKKTGRPHLVNTHMRVKPAAQLVLNGRVFARVAHNKNNLWFL